MIQQFQVVATGVQRSPGPYGYVMDQLDAGRYAALDGLRGIAACVVLVHHCCLVSPKFATAVDSNGHGVFESWTWWTVFSPLHLIWAGQEAVFLFFILSGFVLALARLRSRRESWLSYYCRRLSRIYLPVWASLGFAMVTVWIAPRTAKPSFSSWLNKHDEIPDPIADGFLLFGAGSLNSPLWSLRWEVLFSLLLPVFCISARWMTSSWLMGIIGLLTVVGVGDVLEEEALVFLPMFGIGVLLACQREVLIAWAAKFRFSMWCGLLILTLALLSSRWLLPGLPAANAMAAAGGALLIFMFVGSKGTAAVGSASALQWLGKLSFSLYLVHEPVVVTVALMTHSNEPVLVGLLAVPLSLILAVVFRAVVEIPSLRLASAVGGFMQSKAWRPAFLK